MATLADRTARRTAKVRRNVRRSAGDRARLSVFRSSKHIYAQVIDDSQGGKTKAAATLHHLGYPIDVDQLVGEFAFAFFPIPSFAVFTCHSSVPVRSNVR